MKKIRTDFLYLLVCLLFARVACGQESLDRVFHCTHVETGQDVQEIATVIRSIAGIQQVSVDTAKRLLAVHGTADQIDLAAWLFNELNNPPGQTHDSARHEYRMPGEGDDAVRVFYLAHTGTLQEFQELVTMVRSIVDIRWLFTYWAPKAVVVRGQADRIAMAEWMFNELAQTSDGQFPASRNQYSAIYEYPPQYGPDHLLRVFYLKNAATFQDFQELAVVVRTAGDIRRLFTYYAPKAVAVRGTADQLALAEWLFSELEKPPNPATLEFQFAVGNDPDTVVRIFYPTHTETVQAFQNIVMKVRKATGIRRAFTYNRPRAVVLRGPPSQIALADRLFREYVTEPRP